MKKTLFALTILAVLAVAPALFLACSSDGEMEGEELIGSVVEPEPVLEGGQGARIAPFAYRFTGSDTQIDITGQFALNTAVTSLSIKFSGIDEHRIDLQLSPFITDVGDSFYFGNGQILYRVMYSPPGYIYGSRYGGSIQFSCLILDASNARKAFAQGTIENINPF